MLPSTTSLLSSHIFYHFLSCLPLSCAFLLHMESLVHLFTLPVEHIPSASEEQTVVGSGPHCPRCLPCGWCSCLFQDYCLHGPLVLFRGCQSFSWSEFLSLIMVQESMFGPTALLVKLFLLFFFFWLFGYKLFSILISLIFASSMCLKWLSEILIRNVFCFLLKVNL